MPEDKTGRLSGFGSEVKGAVVPWGGASTTCPPRRRVTPLGDVGTDRWAGACGEVLGSSCRISCVNEWLVTVSLGIVIFDGLVLASNTGRRSGHFELFVFNHSCGSLLATLAVDIRLRSSATGEPPGDSDP